MTGYIISYQEESGGHNGLINVNDTVTSITIITIPMEWPTYSIYSVSIVATSRTLPSIETTVTDIYIGAAITTE